MTEPRSREKVDLLVRNVRDIGHLAWEAEELERHDAALRAALAQAERERDEAKQAKNQCVVELYQKLDERDATIAELKKGSHCADCCCARSCRRPGDD